MHEFFQQHPALCFVFMAIMLMLGSRLDYSVGLEFIAYLGWFLGGILGAFVLSCSIGGYLLFLGIFRWPIAAIVFSAGMYALWHFRPKNRNPQ